MIALRHGLAAALLLSASLAPAADPAASNSPSATCMKNAEQTGEMLRSAPPAVAPTAKLMALIAAPQICSCMDTDEARLVTVDSSDPEMQYLAANASCLSAHVGRAFPAHCPAIYTDLLPVMGYARANPEELAKLCECASANMTASLTPKAVLQSQLQHYRHFQALVQDRKTGTNTAAALKPGPDAFDAALQGLKFCTINVLGLPQLQDRPAH